MHLFFLHSTPDLLCSHPYPLPWCLSSSSHTRPTRPTRASPRPGPAAQATGTITCGPLQRGHPSTEDIHAVQFLERLTATNLSLTVARGAASPSLSRLLRANIGSSALAAVHMARAKLWYRPNLELYATFVSSAPSDPAVQ